MQKAIKFLHSLASCGLIGALAGYMIVLIASPQDTPAAYADMRQSINALSNYLLLPSLAVALVSGLVSMIVQPVFLERRWVWVKALSGLAMFEGTLAIIGAKANHAAEVSIQIAEGTAKPDALDTALAYEWYSLAFITALAVANIALGVWRPRLGKRHAQPAEPVAVSDAGRRE